MKLFEATHTFLRPWSVMTAAAWQKYPNPLRPDVVAVDVLDRRVTEDGKLLTQRLITYEGKLPAWFSSLFGNEPLCYSFEESIVDPKTQTMTQTTRNLTGNNVLSVSEICEYKAGESGNTVQDQVAEIRAFAGFSALCHRIENHVHQQFDKSAQKGREAIECVAEMLHLDHMESQTN
eukprot:Clim_evm27s55 gene=Clim_evmTU27s55